MGQLLEETFAPKGVENATPPSGIELIDRLGLLFYQARALEYAINGCAHMEPVAREALMGLALRHANELGDLLEEIEEGR